MLKGPTGVWPVSRAVGVAVVIALTASGCSGRDGGAGGAGASSPPDTCELFSPAELKLHVNVPADVPAKIERPRNVQPISVVGLDVCGLFAGQNRAVHFGVGRTSFAKETFDKFRRTETATGEVTPVKGLGTEAAWASSTGTLVVLDEGLLLAVKVLTPPEDGGNRLTRAMRLARLGLDRLRDGRLPRGSDEGS